MLKKYESLARKSDDRDYINGKINFEKPSEEDMLKLTEKTKRALEEKLSKKITAKGVRNKLD
jgi:hypothetical protein